jgi:hypothetical protein
VAHVGTQNWNATRSGSRVAYKKKQGKDEAQLEEVKQMSLHGGQYWGELIGQK